VLIYFGIFLVTGTLLSNLMSGINPEDVLRETWNYYPNHYIAAIASLLLGIIFWTWHVIERIIHRKNKL